MSVNAAIERAFVLGATWAASKIMDEETIPTREDAARAANLYSQYCLNLESLEIQEQSRAERYAGLYPYQAKAIEEAEKRGLHIEK